MNGTATLGGSAREGWTVLSPTITKKIDDVFNFGTDLMIGIATDIIKREAFHGGMTYVMQEKSKEPQDFDADTEEWAEHTMKKALDFYYKYGMCPVMRPGQGHAADPKNEAGKSSSEKTESGAIAEVVPEATSEAGISGAAAGNDPNQKIRRFIIPSTDAGHFLARMTYDGQIEVGFQLHRYAGSHHPTSVTGRDVSPTPGIHVYVWSGKTPVPNSPTPFRSLVYRLLPTQLNMKELWKNDMDASYTNSRPSMILVRPHNNSGQATMDQETELAIFQDALSVAGPATMQYQQASRNDDEFTTRLQKQLRRMREMSGGGSRRPGVDGRLVGAQIIRYQNWEQGNVFFAPSGMITTAPAMAQRETNITQRSEWWQRIVAQQFGVPMQYLDRGAGSNRPGASANLTSAQTDACALLRKTVQEARNRMVRFFEAAHDALFRGEDTDRLVSKIMKGQRKNKQRQETLREYELHLSGRPGIFQRATIERQQEEMEWDVKESRLRTVINRVFTMALERTSLAMNSSMIARLARQELEQDQNQVGRLKGKVLPAQRRFQIKWRQPILVDMVMLNWMSDKGFMHDDAMREIVFREYGLPEDLPSGTIIEERLAIIALKYAPKETGANGTSSSKSKTSVSNTSKSQSKKISSGTSASSKGKSSSSSSKSASEPKKKKQKTKK